MRDIYAEIYALEVELVHAYERIDTFCDFKDTHEDLLIAAQKEYDAIEAKLLKVRTEQLGVYRGKAAVADLVRDLSPDRRMI